MAWWTWFLLGFALILLEMATPGGFYFIFFGLSAVLAIKTIKQAKAQ